MKHKEFLGRILIDKKLISQGQLDEALGVQKKEGAFLGSILIEKGFIREDDLLNALSEQFDIPFVKAGELRVDWDIAKLFSKTLIETHRCFPVEKNEDESVITVALTNPLDAMAVAELEASVPGYTIRRILVTSRDLDTLLQFYRNRSKEAIARFFRQTGDTT